MSAPSSPNIFDQWDTYHKVVAANFMFHREIAEALRRALAARFSGRRPAFLDLGCGDATALAPVLRDQPPSGYKGVDLSETALELAARELADLPCPVTLTHGDILEALDEDDSYDAIHSSFVLHHCRPSGRPSFSAAPPANSRRTACCCWSTSCARRTNRSMIIFGAIAAGCAANGRV